MVSVEVSSKDIKIASYAYNEAYKSPCLMKHGCVATINGKIVGRGHNHYRTNSKDGFINDTCSCHAEIDTLRNVFYMTKMNVKERKYQLKVV